MVLPDEEAEQHHAEDAGDGDPVAPERFAREDGQDLEDDPEAGQGEHIHLRVAEEPEQVLEQVGAAAGAGEEVRGLHAAVEGDHQQGGDQHRGREHHQDRGAEGAPAEDRQPPQVRPGARMVTIVAIMFRPSSIIESPTRAKKKM